CIDGAYEFLQCDLGLLIGSPANKVVLDHINRYYKTRKPVKILFSEEFLNLIKNDFIMVYLDFLREDYGIVKESTLKKVVDYFLDYFIDDFSNLEFKHIEMED
ncbi:MAG: hypothetical protein ACFFG0_52145, partial [Candidatus Thorarchaeota archaeon]